MTLTFHIGGFKLSCDTGAMTLADPDPRYADFLTPPCWPFRATDLRVSLETGAPSMPSDAVPLFEAPGAWRAFARGSDRWLEHAPNGIPPEWSAAFSLDPPCRFTVRCGAGLFSPDAAGRPILRSPVAYPLDYLLMMYALLNDGLLLHACGVVLDGRALLLTGVSGSGKSTMARLWAARPDAVVLSDDRVILRWVDGRLVAFGTPWLGDAGAACNRGAPVAAIGYLKQAPADALTPIPLSGVLSRLLRTVSLPWFDRQVVGLYLDRCGRLAAEIPHIDVGFKPGDAIVDQLCHWLGTCPPPGGACKTDRR